MPVPGSTEGAAQPERCAGHVGVEHVEPLLPHRACRCWRRARPGAPARCRRCPRPCCRYTRSPKTTGPERPPYGAFHARLSPAGDHAAGRFFSVEVPSRLGPRHSGQSASRPCPLKSTAVTQLVTAKRVGFMESRWEMPLSIGPTLYGCTSWASSQSSQRFNEREPVLMTRQLRLLLTAAAVDRGHRHAAGRQLAAMARP